jgi:hypothetical protein
VKWLERTKRRLTMLVDGTMPVAWGRMRTDDGGGLGAYRSGTEFCRGDGHVCGRFVFEAAGLENVLYARGVLEIRIGFLQRGDGMIST